MSKLIGSVSTSKWFRKFVDVINSRTEEVVLWVYITFEVIVNI